MERYLLDDLLDMLDSHRMDFFPPLTPVAVVLSDGGKSGDLRSKVG